MFIIKKQYQSANGLIVNIDDDKKIKINTLDNRNMKFEDFKILINNGYSFIFDFTSKIDYNEKRICNRCKKSKLLYEDFYINRKCNKGFTSICKECANKKNK